MRRNSLSYLVDILLLAAFCALFFWRIWTPILADRWRFVPGDFAYQYFAPAHFAADRLHAGSLPLWQTYSYAGHPFGADIQNATFYPIRLANLLVNARGGFAYAALEAEAILHFLFAACFTYLLARRLTASRAGALVAAVTFAFSGYLTSYPPLQLGILEGQAWLPLLLWLWDLAAGRWLQGERRSATRFVIGAGLTLGVSILAGSAQSSLLIIYGTVAFALFRLWPAARVFTWSNWGPRLGMLALYGLVGLGTAAIQVLPSWEFVSLSARVSIGFEEAGAGFVTYELLQLFLPAVGGQFPALYVGVLPLGLATLALAVVRKDSGVPRDTRRLTAFLGWVVLLSLVLSFGKHLALYAVPYLIAPGWRLFRHQERTIVWAVLGSALLAGYGMAWLSRRWVAMRSEALPKLALPSAQGSGAFGYGSRLWGGSPERTLVSGYGLAALGALMLAIVFFVGYQAGNDGLWGFTSAALLLALLLCLVALALRSRRPALLLALLVLDLFTLSAGHYAHPADEVDPFPSQPLLAIALADDDTFRMVNEDCLADNYGAVYGLEDVGGASPLLLGSYEEWLRRLPPERAWRLLNVKYVISWRQYLEVPAERLAEEPGPDEQHKPVYLYRLLEPGPRAWLAGQAIAEPNPGQVLPRLLAPEFDLVQQVVLSSVPLGFGTTERCNGEIIWRKREPERLELAVTTDQPCILVLSELDYPGWRATVNGAPASILRADGILRALALDPGQHEVSFVFRPASVCWGAVISLVTVFLAAGWLVLGERPYRP